MTNPPTGLCARGIEKSFKKRKVVRRVELDVQPGEVVGLLGPNGAGKSTAFYMISGRIRADQGQVFLNGKDVTNMPMYERALLGLGYLPQEASIFRKLTVKQNIQAILEYRQDLSSAAKRDKLESLLGDFNIIHVKNSLGQALSGGERRRVEIARALAANPSYILLDEPFAGVDPISVMDIQRIITELKNRNIGVLITDHNVRETLTICERAYILNAGEIIAAGQPDEVLANEQVRDIYLGQDFTL